MARFVVSGQVDGIYDRDRPYVPDTYVVGRMFVRNTVGIAPAGRYGGPGRCVGLNNDESNGRLEWTVGNS